MKNIENREKNNNNLVILLSLIGFVILISLDQITKRWAILNLKGKINMVLIKDVFDFSYVENRGAAWGILEDGTIFFIIITFLATVMILFYYFYIPFKKKFLIFRILLVFLLSGAIGNVIDRITKGYVVDFLYFKLINFPVFNVADIYVTCSIIILAIIIIFYYNEEDLNCFKITKAKNK